MRLFGQFLNWTLAITLHSKPRRLAARPTPEGLLPCRPARATRKKSPATTTPCALAPEHRRRSGTACRTTPPGGRLPCSVPFAGVRGE
jgi:hypothetical protein